MPMPNKKCKLNVLIIFLCSLLLITGCQAVPIKNNTNNTGDSRSLLFKIYPHYNNVVQSTSPDGNYIAVEDPSSSRISYASRSSLNHAEDRHDRKKHKKDCTKYDKHSSYFLSKSGWMELIFIRNEVVILGKEDNEELSRLNGHCLRLREIVFSPDNLILATGGRDSIVNLWDWKKGERLGEFGSIDHINPRVGVIKLVFSHDSQQLAALYSNNDVILMNPLTGKLLVDIDHYQHYFGRISKEESINRKQNKIVAISYSDDAKYLLLAQTDRIAIHDAYTGELVKYLFHQNLKSITDMVVDRKNKLLIVSTSSSSSKNISVWNTSNWELINTINEPRTMTHMAVSKDSRFLVTAGSDTNLNVYSLPDIKIYQVIQFLKKEERMILHNLHFDFQNNLHFSTNKFPNKNENGELIPVAIH